MSDSMWNKIPEIEEAIESIPELHNTLEKLDMDTWVYDPNATDLSNKIMIGLLQKEILLLSEKLKSIKDKYEVVKAGEKNWKLFKKIKGRQLFISETGDIAEIPLELLKMVKGNIDLTIDIKTTDSKVEFVDGSGRRICVLPKTLLVVLDRLIKDMDI